MPNRPEFLERLKIVLCNNIDNSGNFGEQITESLTRIDSITEWASLTEVINDRKIVNSIALDLQQSLIQSVTGVIEAARVLLRRALELSLSYVYFSAYPIERQLWLRGKKDISWSDVTEEQFGVFSLNFSSAFCADINDSDIEKLKAMRSMAISVYRNLSETVHGDVSRVESRRISLEFDDELFRGWYELLVSVIDLTHTAFGFRFLSAASTTDQQRLVDLVQDHLLSWDALREAVGLRVRGADG